MSSETDRRTIENGLQEEGRSHVTDLDRAARELLSRVGPLLLRLSLGIVLVWFGLLKVSSASAVGGLVATTVPFESSWFVPVLGAVEVVIGLAFATGRFVRAMLLCSCSTWRDVLGADRAPRGWRSRTTTR